MEQVLAFSWVRPHQVAFRAGPAEHQRIGGERRRQRGRRIEDQTEGRAVGSKRTHGPPGIVSVQNEATGRVPIQIGIGAHVADRVSEGNPVRRGRVGRIVVEIPVLDSESIRIEQQVRRWVVGRELHGGIRHAHPPREPVVPALLKQVKFLFIIPIARILRAEKPALPVECQGK